MSRATDLLNLGALGNYSWWVDMERAGSGIRVTVDDPDHGEGTGHTITRELSAPELHASFNALAKTVLCCGEVMKEDGYWAGCANDADMVLQHAALGEIVYS